MKLKVKVGLPGFGDHVLAALWTQILRDNKIDARIELPENLSSLFDIPLSDGTEENVYVFDYKYKFTGGRGIIAQNQVKSSHVLNKDIYITRNIPPVIIQEPNQDKVDVVLCCKSSKFSIFRDWPHEEKLRMKLAKNGYTFRSIVNETYSPKTLGLIKHAKAFITVETGLAHYASPFSYKGLVIASGHAHIDYWSTYNYHHLSIDMPCRNCFLIGEKASKCMYNIACMDRITVPAVMNELNVVMSRSL